MTDDDEDETIEENEVAEFKDPLEGLESSDTTEAEYKMLKRLMPGNRQSVSRLSEREIKIIVRLSVLKDWRKKAGITDEDNQFIQNIVDDFLALKISYKGLGRKDVVDILRKTGAMPKKRHWYNRG
jgi:hypothetical protein